MPKKINWAGNISAAHRYCSLKHTFGNLRRRNQLLRQIKENRNEDGVDRRGFLQCMAWAGTGMIWTASGGLLSSKVFGQMAGHQMEGGAEFNFVQISDSHIGFNKAANTDVTATLQEAIGKINALERTPDFLIHTGDLSHLSKPGEFDTLDQVLKSAKCGQTFFVPGEHDMLTDNGQQYLERYGKGTKGAGWFSFDHKDVHFVGLVNVVDLKAGGLGTLGPEQLKWLEKDLAGRSSSTPIVVFAHIPLWTVYPEWGWGTEDGATALSYMKRFGSVTVLNGHIHQTMQKIEGEVFYHTAMSTAFPQPKPGTAPSPGPMKVPAGQLRDVLGITQATYIAGRHMLAVADSTLAMSAGPRARLENTAGANQVKIDNFSFAPRSMRVKAGAVVTWTNADDIPHNVISTDKKFSSPVLDTDEAFSFRFDEPGSYPYFCKIHPMMTGTITVEKDASGTA
jgi:3',5'-cyclic-AMP phosphodiesterase